MSSVPYRGLRHVILVAQTSCIELDPVFVLTVGSAVEAQVDGDAQINLRSGSRREEGRAVYQSNISVLVLEHDLRLGVVERDWNWVGWVVSRVSEHLVIIFLVVADRINDRLLENNLQDIIIIYSSKMK